MPLHQWNPNTNGLGLLLKDCITALKRFTVLCCYRCKDETGLKLEKIGLKLHLEKSPNLLWFALHAEVKLIYLPASVVGVLIMISGYT